MYVVKRRFSTDIPPWMSRKREFYKRPFVSVTGGLLCWDMNDGGTHVKKYFLILYGAVVIVLTVGFLLYGERRDPRFYLSLLLVTALGKMAAWWIDRKE